MKRFLLCTDGSAYSAVSCRYASWLARLAGAEITALYLTDIRQFEIPFVADFSGSLGVQPYQDLLSRIQGLEKEKAAVIEETTRRLLDETGFEGKFTFVHKTGLLVDHIEEMEQDADLVILGKRGSSADTAILHLGSNLERVVRASRRPCLVTSRAFREVRRILFAYDGGASCHKALEFLTNFPAFSTMDLRLLSVIGEKDPIETCQAAQREVVDRLIAARYEVNATILRGNVEEAIGDYVTTEEIDLLIMGAYGHNRIRQLLIGSTSTALMRTCRIPVLCFR